MYVRCLNFFYPFFFCPVFYGTRPGAVLNNFFRTPKLRAIHSCRELLKLLRRGETFISKDTNYCVRRGRRPWCGARGTGAVVAKGRKSQRTFRRFSPVPFFSWLSQRPSVAILIRFRNGKSKNGPVHPVRATINVHIVACVYDERLSLDSGAAYTLNTSVYTAGT